MSLAHLEPDYIAIARRLDVLYEEVVYNRFLSDEVAVELTVRANVILGEIGLHALTAVDKQTYRVEFSISGDEAIREKFTQAMYELEALRALTL